MSVSTEKSIWIGVLAILYWMISGYTMIIFNNIVLSTWKFSFPFFLSSWHMLVSTLGTQLLARTTNMLPSVRDGKVTYRAYLYSLAPASLFFSGGVVLGNSAYQYISVGYIQMIKAITPVPLLLMYFMQGREKLSYVQLLIVCVISLGVIVSSVGELEFTWIGFSIQFTAVLCDCSRVISLDGALKDLQVDALSVLYYTAPISFVLTCVGCLLIERDRLLTALYYDHTFTTPFCWMLLFNALIAFNVNFASLFALNATNGMVVSVCGPIKDIIVIFSSAMIFGHAVTGLQWIGFMISFLGILGYRAYKQDPMILQQTLTHVSSCN